MKHLTLLALLLLPILAQAEGSRPLETVDEAQRRHEAERYEQYRQRGNTEPLGGYSDRLGDPYPAGPSRSPVYTPSSRPGGTWQDRAKR